MTSGCTAIIAKYETPLVIHSDANLWLFIPVFLTGTLPYTFYFGVKFYAADPCKLFEEITRYSLFSINTFCSHF